MLFDLLVDTNLLSTLKQQMKEIDLMDDLRTNEAFSDAVANLASDIESYDACDPFDLTNRWRLAKRMTGEIYLIAVSRGKNHRSLVDTLGLAEEMRLPSCAMEGGIYGAPLLQMKAFHQRVVFSPRKRIDDSMPRLTVCEWLHEIIYQSKRFNLTRQNILSTIRDKEGVAHFDKKISRQSGYSALRNSGHEDYYWRASQDGTCIALCAFGSKLFITDSAPEKGVLPPPLQEQKHPLLGGVDASVRTIAEELSDWLRAGGFMKKR